MDLKNALYIVSIPIGNPDDITLRAIKVLTDVDILVCEEYRNGSRLMKQLGIKDKKIITTTMRREEERCILALEEAETGADVAFICSGDAGVYGMAGLIYETAQDYPDVEIQVIPGVTAALSGAARLGAPLIHDFALISLSDLMTSWEKIQKRLRMAAEGDFAIVLYNPSSRKRADYLQKACDILLETLSPDQICGTVRNIGRDGEETHIYTLAELRDVQVDMFTTVFIGNSSTKRIGGHMVTPRGYARERKTTSF